MAIKDAENLHELFNTTNSQEYEGLYQKMIIETMKGLAQTVDERGAWIDFGDGSVDGLTEMMSTAITQYWSDGVGASAQNHQPIVLAIRLVSSDRVFGDEDNLQAILASSSEFRDEKKPQAPIAVAKPVEKEKPKPVVENFVEKATALKETMKDNLGWAASMVGIGSKKPEEKPEEKTEEQKEKEAKEAADEAKLAAEEEEKAAAAAANSATDDATKAKDNAAAVVTGGRQRVHYKLIRDEAKRRQSSWDLSTPKRFMTDTVTHVVFVHSLQVRDDLRTKLKQMGMNITLVANGHRHGSDSLYRTILSDAKFGAQFIVFDNTGGAAQQIANDLRQQRKSTSREPDVISAQQFKIIDPLKPLENSAKTLANVLFAIQEAEETESGYLEAERRRVQYAWEQHVIFLLNSSHYKKLARFLQLTVVILAFFTTTSAVLSSQCDNKRGYYLGHFPDWSVTKTNTTFLDSMCGFAGGWPGGFGGTGIVTQSGVLKENWLKLFRTLVVLLPLVGSVVLSVTNKLSPNIKWAHLKSGSCSLQSEIYMYRARATRYSRASASKDVEDVVEELCAMTSESAPPGGPSRRATFAAECSRIINDSLGSDMMYDYLEDPAVEAKINTVKLFDSDVSHREPTCCQRLFSCCEKSEPKKAVEEKKKEAKPDKAPAKAPRGCCSCLRRGSGVSALSVPLIAGDEQEAPVDLWNTGGNDFEYNPNTVEGDYIKDDGCSLLNAEEYTHVRLYPMLQHYHRQAKFVGRVVKTLQLTITLTTGLTTLVAAIPASVGVDFRPCVPVMVAFVSVLATMLEFENFQARLTNVQKSLQELKNLQIWWHSLSSAERVKRVNKDRLVATTEEQADAEISPWKKSSQPTPQGGGGDEEQGAKKKKKKKP